MQINIQLFERSGKPHSKKNKKNSNYPPFDLIKRLIIMSKYKQDFTNSIASVPWRICAPIQADPLPFHSGSSKPCTSNCSGPLLFGSSIPLPSPVKSLLFCCSPRINLLLRRSRISRNTNAARGISPRGTPTPALIATLWLLGCGFGKAEGEKGVV